MGNFDGVIHDLILNTFTQVVRTKVQKETLKRLQSIYPEIVRNPNKGFKDIEFYTLDWYIFKTKKFDFPIPQEITDYYERLAMDVMNEVINKMIGE